jgi:chitodextrinase
MQTTMSSDSMKKNESKKSKNNFFNFGQLKRSKFSTPQLVVFVLVFGAIGYLIFRTFAAGGTPYSVTSSLTDKGTISGQVSWSITTSPQPYKVDFFIDGVKSSTTELMPPFVYNGDGGVLDTTQLANGPHTFGEVAVFDNQGGPVNDPNYTNTGSTVTSVHKLTVSNAGSDTTPPSVSITTPTNGANVSGTVNIAANATDNVGVSSVLFIIDSTNLGSPITTMPYSKSWDSKTVNNGSHVITATARDAAGNVTSTTAVVSVANADTTPPSAPANLSASAAAYNRVNLSWTASSDNVGVSGYYIIRNGTTIATTSSTSYADTSVTASTNYQYQVQAYDTAGNISALSNIAQITTPSSPDTSPPSAPTGLTAVAVSSSQINLSWSASSDNVGVVAYDVYRNGVKIGSPSTTSFGDSGLAASTTYSYYIVARDAAGNSSSNSAPVSATTSSPQVTTSNLQGTIYSNQGGTLAFTSIKLQFGGGARNYSADSNGFYYISNLPAQTVINATYSQQRFLSTYQQLVLPAGQTVTHDVTLISRK